MRAECSVSAIATIRPRRTTGDATPVPAESRDRRIQHGYIWIWLVIFAMPFVATILHSLQAPRAASISSYHYVFGCFRAIS